MIFYCRLDMWHGILIDFNQTDGLELAFLEIQNSGSYCQTCARDKCASNHILSMGDCNQLVYGKSLVLLVLMDLTHFCLK